MRRNLDGMLRGGSGALKCVALGWVALGLVACADSAPPSPPGSSESPFELVTIDAIEMLDERSIDGRVEGERQAVVTAQVPGQVSAVLRDAESTVASGEPILRVRATQVQGGLAQAAAALREAEAFATDAETRFQRISTLYERQVVPRAAYDQALAQRESAVARREAARASRDAASAYTVVTAPFSGVVTERRVRVGDTVAPGMPLFGIASVNRLRVRAELPESLVQAAREQRRVLVYLEGERVAADNILIFAAADTRDGSFGLQADLPERVQGVSPGMLVKLGVVVGRRSGLRVPHSAVIERGEVTGAYVVSEGDVRFRQLRLGRRVDDQVEVLAGLIEGEQVVRRAVDVMGWRQGTSGTGQ